MARTAKDTVTIPVNGTDTEFNPVLGFELDSVSKEKLAYLVQLGLKQRTAIAVRKIVGEMIPAVEVNLKNHADMVAFGFDPKDEKMVKMFAGKVMVIPSDVPVSESDIFPAKLDANAVEPVAAPTESVPEVVTVPDVPPVAEKPNGRPRGRK